MKTGWERATQLAYRVGQLESALGTLLDALDREAGANEVRVERTHARETLADTTWEDQ